MDYEVPEIEQSLLEKIRKRFMFVREFYRSSMPLFCLFLVVTIENKKERVEM